MQAAMSEQMKDMKEMKADLLTKMEDFTNNQPKAKCVEQPDSDTTETAAMTPANVTTAVYTQDLTLPVMEQARSLTVPGITTKTCCGSIRYAPLEVQTCCGTMAATNNNNHATCTAQHPTAITEIVTTASSAPQKKKGNTPLLPHLYVRRASKREKIVVGEATIGSELLT